MLFRASIFTSLSSFDSFRLDSKHTHDPIATTLFLHLRGHSRKLKISTSLRRSKANMPHHTPAEIFSHNKQQDIWLLINGKVYDVSKFSEDHPGGEEILVSAAGKDATDDFEDVGHSSSAKAMMEQYYIGDVHPLLPVAPKKDRFTVTPPKNDEIPSRVLTWIFQYIIPLSIFGVAIAVKSYLTKENS